MKKYNLLILCIISCVLVSCSGRSDSSTKTSEQKVVNVVGIIQSGDIDRCLELKETKKIENCKNNIHLEKAMAGNNPTECDNITDSGAIERCKNQTYLNLALNSANPEICMKIPGKQEYIISCKDQIILNQAFSGKNKEVCKKLVTASKIADCEDSIQYNEARDTHDIKKCASIHSETNRNQCTKDLTTAQK